MNDTDPLELLRAAGAHARKPAPQPAGEPVPAAAPPAPVAPIPTPAPAPAPPSPTPPRAEEPPEEPSEQHDAPEPSEPAASSSGSGVLPVWPAKPPEPLVTVDDPPPPARSSVLDSLTATGERRRRRKHSTTRNAIEWVVVLLGALLVALAVKTWLVQAFYIPSGSMEPTLQVGDRILVNKVSYDLDEVDRGDIVVFERPESWGSGDIDDLIKRVIALPGETVSVVDGVVHIDGEPLEEPWLPDGVQTPSFFQESGCVPQCTVPEDEIFVLGDNRPHSDASNHFGSVPFDNVVGRAFVRLWPIGDLGGL